MISIDAIKGQFNSFDDENMSACLTYLLNRNVISSGNFYSLVQIKDKVDFLLREVESKENRINELEKAIRKMVILTELYKNLLTEGGRNERDLD